MIYNRFCSQVDSNLALIPWTKAFLLKEISKRASRFFHRGSTSDSSFDKIRQMYHITLAPVSFKPFSNLKHIFVKNLFIVKINSGRRMRDLNILVGNSLTFRDNSMRRLGPKIWYAVPEKYNEEAA